LGLKSVGLKADELGFALDQTAEVSLDAIARVMIHYSGNAATDYLLTRIGEESMAKVLAEAELEHQTPIRLLLGAVLVMFNHEYVQPDIQHLQGIIADVANGKTEYVEQLVALYLDDPAWRTAQIQYMADYNARVSLSEQDLWTYQEAASHLFPRGTAGEYAHIIAQVAAGKFISVEVSAIMQHYLESVPSDWLLRTLFFDRFGAKDGVTVGVLTIASYAVPKRGELAGENRVVVILANDMPLDQWSKQLQLAGHYLLQTDLAQATGIFDNQMTGIVYE
jgi:D-alanyl-D-alanine carboxypeptidase